MEWMSKSEAELMQLIWAQGGPVTAAQLLAALAVAGKGWKHTTVLTFLSRMVDKGLLTVGKEGKTNWYQAVFSQAQYRAQETEAFLQEVHGGSLQSFLAALYGGGKLAPEELAELGDWLAKRKEEA